MSFWTRHVVLMVLCVIAPFSAALYMDTSSTVEQAKKKSRRALQLAVPSLQLILQNEAYRAVSSAMSTARRTLDNGAYGNLKRSGARRESAVKEISQLLGEAAPRGGFAWLVDAEGEVILADGQTALDDSPRSIRGHPVFQETRLGYALDGVWSSHRGLVQVAGAPLVDDGAIVGAILIGRPIDKNTIAEWAETLRGHITLASEAGVVVSSAPEDLAKTVVEAAHDAVSPVYAGVREEPFTDSAIPLLPLLVDHRAAGEAYVSFGTPVIGAPSKFQWIISVDAAGGLVEVAERQSVVLGAMVASFLLALLIGILNYRSYVSPNDVIAEHLSELQMGRGDLEMPESMVSRPFRRLVRLINMTVQKIPNRTMAVPTADLSSITRPPPSDEDVAFGDPSRSASMVPTPQRPPTPVPVAPPSEELPLAADAIEAMSLESLSSVPSLGSGSLAPQLANGSDAYESSEETQAASLPPQLVAEPVDSQLPDLGLLATPGAEAAIAEAIAQLEGAQMEPFGNGGADRKSAADIRGRPMGGVPSSPPEPFEDVSIPPSAGPPPGVRGGGSLDLGQVAALPSNEDPRPPFGPEETVVAPVATELLARSARDDLTGRHAVPPPSKGDKPDATVVANVPADLLAATLDSEAMPRGASMAQGGNLDPEDRAHFKEVYERFIDLRRRCGESTGDLAFDRFLAKLSRNRENLVKKYKCRTVRFQVYKKDGKAALKATPVGGR